MSFEELTNEENLRELKVDEMAVGKQEDEVSPNMFYYDYKNIQEIRNVMKYLGTCVHK